MSGRNNGGGVVGKNHIGAVVCVSCHVREEQRGGGVVGKNHRGAVVCVSCHVREEQRGGGGCREES